MGGQQRPVRAPQLNFEVTAEIIEESIPKESSHCMIADALKAAMPNASYVSVDLATIRFTDRAAGRRYIYLTPRTAQQALIAFDQGERPGPFTIRAHASQMIKTGTAARAPKIRDENDPEPRPDDEQNSGRSEKHRKYGRKVEPARIVPTDNDGSNVPIKVGGQVPPIGMLAKGAHGGKAVPRTGQRREFGLRTLIR